MVIRRRIRRCTDIDTNTDTNQQHVLDLYLKQVSQRGVESVHATPVYQSLKKILQRNDADTVAAFHSNVLRAVQLRNRSNVEISVQVSESRRNASPLKNVQNIDILMDHGLTTCERHVEGI